MKRFYFLASLSLLLTSCLNQFDDLTQFELEYTTSATVASTIGINLPVNLDTPPIETNSQSRFETKGTRANLVEQVKLKSLVIDLTSPSGADFSFLERITFFIKAEGENEIQIATKNPVPTSTGVSLELEVNDVNLRDYIIKSAFDLRINVSTDETIFQDHDFTVVTVFDVKAKLF